MPIYAAGDKGAGATAVKIVAAATAVSYGLWLVPVVRPGVAVDTLKNQSAQLPAPLPRKRRSAPITHSQGSSVVRILLVTCRTAHEYGGVAGRTRKEDGAHLSTAKLRAGR